MSAFNCPVTVADTHHATIDRPFYYTQCPSLVLLALWRWRAHQDHRLMAMRLKNSGQHYGWIARILHWTTVALVVMLFIDISGLDVPPKNTVRESHVAFHLSLGLVVGLLMTVRLGWRWVNPNPVDHYGLSGTYRFWVVNLHRTLYVLILTICATGVVIVFANGDTLSVFNIIRLEPFLRPNIQVQNIADIAHARLSLVLLLLVLLHATTAIINLIASPAPQKATSQQNPQKENLSS